MSRFRLSRRTLVFENKTRFHEKCILLFRGKTQLFQGHMQVLCILLYTCLKRPVQQNQGFSRKNVYFCILLYTVHVGRGVVSCRINRLSATDA